MSAIQMSLGYAPPAIELPCAFIDRYMLKCTPVYALIYIYGLRQCIGGATSISSQEIGQIFQILETDVVNAWRYWENEGLIRLEARGDAMTVIFLPISTPIALAPVAAVKTEKPAKPEAPAKVAEPAVGAVVKSFVPSGRPQYTVEELAIYKQQSRDIERLFTHAEQALAKMLTYHDMNLLFGFYDWLRLPVDVILYLLTYCAERGHRDLRYIEKAAMDWAENQVDDVEKALVYVQTFDHDYRDILRAMGQNSGYPTPTQRKYIDKWLGEFQMPAALVLEACDRAAAQIGKPKFAYVDKILEEWHKKGIRNLEEAATDAADFARQKAEAAKPEPKIRKSNRFVNFKQRERDYAQLEKMEREYLIQSLKG